MKSKKWTVEEDNYIKENFGKKNYSEMGNDLNCCIATVKRRCAFLGFEVETKRIRRWSKEEIELLREMAPNYLNTEIAKKLDRSVNDLNKKARNLGIKLKFKEEIWNDDKITYLKENINKKSIAELERYLGVHYYQIMNKLKELGIAYESSLWTKEEEETLIRLAPTVYVREIAKILNRTEGSVLSKAFKMGIEYITLKRKYTDSELQYIKDNWGIISISDMARVLGVSRTMVQTQADLMNLPRLGNNPYKKWGLEEIEKLRELAKENTIVELAKIFNTTNNAIISVASKNNIPLKDGKIHWSEEDNEILRELAKTMDIIELSEKMKRSPGAIRGQAGRLGIVIKPNEKHQNSIWTEENTLELKRLASLGKSAIDIAIEMNKNDQTIEKKVRQLGLVLTKEPVHVWSEDEIEKLREQAKSKNLFELVRIFRRSSGSIKMVAKREGIPLLIDRKIWTLEEEEYLRKLIEDERKSLKEVALILGRTNEAIIVKIHKMGIVAQGEGKRKWTSAEIELLEELWGNESFESIATRLNRTVSSIKNKAFSLGLGSFVENNYAGLSLVDISILLNVNITTVSIGWVSLGLKYKVMKITEARNYRYVEIQDLYDFLEKNQNIWDSRNLEKNVLGVEPEWLVEKRKRDEEENFQAEDLKLTKQQLILAKKFFLELQEKKVIDSEQKRLKK